MAVNVEYIFLNKLANFRESCFGISHYQDRYDDAYCSVMIIEYCVLLLGIVAYFSKSCI